jgi:F-type H+-transporting ATPase subunit gamma
MIRLAEIETKVAAMGELREIVGAMRALASMRMQEAQRALPGIRRYAASVASGIADSLRLVGDEAAGSGAKDRGSALILCMAEHGFVGGYNERLVEAVATEAHAEKLLFCIGSRGSAIAAERGLAAAFVHPMATRASAAPSIVQVLSDELYRRIAEGEIARVEVVFASSRRGGAPSIDRHRLLPLDPALLEPGLRREPPLHNLAPGVLRERLVGEYVFALLTEAIVESIASENAARLAAMESAHDNLSKKLDGLRHDARQARQQEITMEISELVTAAAALASKKGRAR